MINDQHLQWSEKLILMVTLAPRKAENFLSNFLHFSVLCLPSTTEVQRQWKGRKKIRQRQDQTMRNVFGGREVRWKFEAEVRWEIFDSSPADKRKREFEKIFNYNCHILGLCSEFFRCSELTLNISLVASRAAKNSPRDEWHAGMGGRANDSQDRSAKWI